MFKFLINIVKNIINFDVILSDIIKFFNYIAIYPLTLLAPARRNGCPSAFEA